MFFLLGLALASPNDTAIHTALEDFVQGGAEQDRARVERALDPAAMQYVITPDTRMTLDTTAYLGLLDAKKIGGHETSMTVHDVNVRDTVATATMTREAGPTRFDDAVTLQKVDGTWKIVAIAVTLGPK